MSLCTKCLTKTLQCCMMGLSFNEVFKMKKSILFVMLVLFVGGCGSSAFNSQSKEFVPNGLDNNINIGAATVTGDVSVPIEITVTETNTPFSYDISFDEATLKGVLTLSINCGVSCVGKQISYTPLLNNRKGTEPTPCGGSNLCTTEITEPGIYSLVDDYTSDDVIVSDIIEEVDSIDNDIAEVTITDINDFDILDTTDTEIINEVIDISIDSNIACVPDCDDNDFCTTDTCDSATGECVHELAVLCEENGYICNSLNGECTKTCYSDSECNPSPTYSPNTCSNNGICECNGYYDNDAGIQVYLSCVNGNVAKNDANVDGSCNNTSHIWSYWEVNTCIKITTKNDCTATAEFSDICTPKS